jgi:hypothetical protein
MTVNQVFYSFLKNNATMISEFTNVYYILNDNETQSAYAVVWMIDDTKDIKSLCKAKQGQARFQCEVYDIAYQTGIDKRELFQDVCKEIEGTITDNINIYQVEILNVGDGAGTVNNLYTFTFEALLHWELDT